MSIEVQESPVVEATSNRVFVGNLAWKATESELADFFAEAGVVQDVEIMREKHHPNRSRGYAFVSFETNEQAALAIEQLNGKEHMGRPLHVNSATPRREDDAS